VQYNYLSNDIYYIPVGNMTHNAFEKRMNPGNTDELTT